MTVTYTAEVATCRGFGCFLKLLTRWRGSIYKLVWPDLATFLFLYYTLNLTYRLALDEQQKIVFEAVVKYCEAYSDLIPLSFVLGFYISIIMQRWWDQYTSIPWPDPIAVFVSSHIHGQDERGRLMRRTIMRYVCLCLTMVFSMISPRVKMRFPTLEHFVEAGLLLENERVIIRDLDEKFPRHSKHWLPIVWAASIVTRARREGRIRDDYASKTIIDELNKFRGQCGMLLNYDSISVPLVYTQVVTLAVYSYFITSVIARQWLEVTPGADTTTKHRSKIDLYFPFFLTLQFFFYMGWLKVAESLINPFGEDDDDFEVNWIVDRNVQVSYLIVDEMHHEHPELIRDQYWDEVLPVELPYTVASEPFREEHPQPSTANIDIPAAGTTLSFNSTLKLDEMAMGDAMAQDDAASGIHFLAKSAGSRPQSHYYDRTLSTSSNTSINTNLGMGSVAGSLHRVASVTSVLKRLFSREPPQQPSAIPMASVETGNAATGLGNSNVNISGAPDSNFKRSTSGSSINLIPKQAPGGSVRLTDQVIEEVDEQTTITSMRRPDPRPNVRDIFAKEEDLSREDKNEADEALLGAPLSSAPVDVPRSAYGAHSQSRPHAALSSSAPSYGGQITVSSPSRFSDNFPEVLSVQSAPGFTPPHSNLGSGGSLHAAPMVEAEETISIGATSSESGDDNDMDEFTRLKRARQKEQRQRQLARSISQQQAAIAAVAAVRRRESGAESIISESENLLMDLTDSSRTGLLSSSPQHMSHPS
ncbi:hypothetical protein FOCC_FOCC008900 [Frankliniella occidentalis]|uniref:Bestrophin homolog n=1 Tax=Frankliniella occidentalis TaxID=133901 RepID=A0A6J1SZ11_FRAOC|nr:bestrophin-2 isoform X1 [Frankliniella occidentalis]KAE8744425.1 hypothetical protein FOCC_FOCC008900 [Frankliniella occidentalis]